MSPKFQISSVSMTITISLKTDDSDVESVIKKRLGLVETVAQFLTLDVKHRYKLKKNIIS